MAGAIHVIISGRVQGVGYRYWTRSQATELGLTGWVRNRRDGTVEAVFAGDLGNIDEMLRRCGDGPPAAAVSGVTSEPCEDPGLAAFEARPTA